MIKTERLLYETDRKLNTLASLKHQFIPNENKLLALNEAQFRLLKKKVNQNNLYRLGFDAFKSRYEDLQNLVVQYEKIKPVKTNESLTSYKIKIEDLKNKYYLPVDIIVKASKGECTNHNVYVKHIVKHGDLVNYINNSFYTPSFSYQETIAIISSNEIIVYTNDDFEVDGLEISYLRYPRKISFEGLIDEEGNETTTVDCELPDYLEDELLELTVGELATNIENYNAAQAAEQKRINAE